MRVWWEPDCIYPLDRKVKLSLLGLLDCSLKSQPLPHNFIWRRLKRRWSVRVTFSKSSIEVRVTKTKKATSYSLQDRGKDVEGKHKHLTFSPPFFPLVISDWVQLSVPLKVYFSNSLHQNPLGVLWKMKMSRSHLRSTESTTLGVGPWDQS